MKTGIFLVWLYAPMIGSALAQSTESGRQQFENRCSVCHGGDGMGGELGPAIVNRLPSRDDQQLAALITEGLPNRGMPASTLSSPEMSSLIGFLRTLRPQR